MSDSKRNSSKPNWLELPYDVTTNILQRIGPIDILESAQKVCKDWHRICYDPALRKVINMFNDGGLTNILFDLQKMCKHAIDRSQGQLVDLNLEFFGSEDLIAYMVNRELFKTLPLLEELSLILTMTTTDAIEDAGKYCPMLRSFKYNQIWLGNDPDYMDLVDAEAIAIAENMTGLRHLELIGNSMTNVGLEAILDGCPHLESLDLRRCFNHNLHAAGDLRKRCCEQIKDPRLPNDSIKGSKGYTYLFDEDEDEDVEKDSTYMDFSDSDVPSSPICSCGGSCVFDFGFGGNHDFLYAVGGLSECD